MYPRGPRSPIYDEPALTKPRRKAANAGTVKTMLTEALGDALGEVGADLMGHIAKLEARIKQLESNPPQVNYDGVYQSGKSYRKGTFVTSGGSLWCAKTDYPAESPGKSRRDWQLCVKKGRDGR